MKINMSTNQKQQEVNEIQQVDDNNNVPTRRRTKQPSQRHYGKQGLDLVLNLSSACSRIWMQISAIDSKFRTNEHLLAIYERSSMLAFSLDERKANSLYLLCDAYDKNSNWIDVYIKWANAKNKFEQIIILSAESREKVELIDIDNPEDNETLFVSNISNSKQVASIDEIRDRMRAKTNKPKRIILRQFDSNCRLSMDMKAWMIRGMTSPYVEIFVEKPSEKTRNQNIGNADAVLKTIYYMSGIPSQKTMLNVPWNLENIWSITAETWVNSRAEPIPKLRGALDKAFIRQQKYMQTENIDNK